MEIAWATAKGDGEANEDYAAAGPGWALIMDGATHFPGVETGCVHDVPWLVRQYAAALTPMLMTGSDDLILPEHLAVAICLVRLAHNGACDLANPDSPSTTVAMLRQRGEGIVEYLVLGDSPIALRIGSEIKVIADDRTDHLPGGRPYSVELVRRMRNSEDGFWIASTSVLAARHAISGTAEGVTSALMVTDGVTRLLGFGLEWEDLFDIAQHQGGPSRLIRLVREYEDRAPESPAKRHDDATAVWLTGLGVAEVTADAYVMVRG